MRWFIIALWLFCMPGLLAGERDFTVTASSADFKVGYGGRPLISGSFFRLDGKNRIKHEATNFHRETMKNGTEVFNWWSEDPAAPFRQEVGLTPEGDEVEISFQTEFDAYHPSLQIKDKLFVLYLPFAALEGMEYSARVYRARGRHTPVITGKIDRSWKNGENLDGVTFSYLALTDGKGRRLVFDFDPVGLPNMWGGYSYSVFRNRWQVVREGERIRLQMAFFPPFHGGSLNGKVKIFAGGMEDFERRHAWNSFSYIQEFKPMHLFSFGAPAAGKEYRRAGTAAFAADNGYGWLEPQGLKENAGFREGAYYSNVSGKGKRQYKVTSLPPGVYLATVGSGNYTGIGNRFSADCNGAELLKDCSVKKHEATVATAPLWIENGEAVFSFDGDFIVSTIGLQFLLARPEDFSFRRGFWLADGYEPAVLFRNDHYRPEPEFALAVESFFLPAPGEEAKGEPKKLIAPVSQPDDPNDPRLDWRYSAVFSSLGPSNNGTMAEFSTPEKLARRLDELKEKNVNAVIVNDMLSRHTFPAHQARAREKLKEIAAAAHQRGMKIINHEDTTLLWNVDSGFRVMTERTPALNRMIANHLPSTHFCLINPLFREPYMDYITDLVRYSDVDALMQDEAIFYFHGCGCAYCRKTFHAETGYHLPVNELSKDLNNPNSKLWKTWKEWQHNRTGSWKGEVRQRIKPFRPDLSILGYTTHKAFTIWGVGRPWGSVLYDVARSLDFIGTEIMPQNTIQNARALIPFRKMKNLFRLAYGCPIFGLVYAHWDWDNAYFGWAFNNMNGQVTWETARECPPGKSDYHAFAPENMDLKQAVPAAEILLYFSIQSRYWDPVMDFRPELFGTAQTLETMHVPYQFIGDMNLTPEFLAAYKVLLLGASGCLSDEQLEVIKDYARKGGIVFMTADTGCFDGIGEPRKTWGFADVFGFNIGGLAKKETIDTLVSPVDGKPVKLRSALRYFPPRGVLPSDAPVMLYGMDAKGARVPLIISRKFGKGTFCHSFSEIAAPTFAEEAESGKKYTYTPDISLDGILKNLLGSLTDGATVWEVNAPEQVYSTLYKQGDVLVAHFLNGAGQNAKAGDVIQSPAPQPAFPPLARDIVFSVNVPELKQVYAVSPDFPGRQEPAFKKLDNGRWQITLPKELLKAYTLVYIR